MIVNPEVRDVFRMRAKVTSFIRRSLDDDNFLEVRQHSHHLRYVGKCGFELAWEIIPW